MSRISSRLSVLLAGVLLIAGCNARAPEIAPQPANSIVSEAGETVSAPPSGAKTDIAEPASSPEDALQAEFKQVMAAAASAADFTTFDRGQGYDDPTLEQLAAMQEKIAALGVPVTARDLDMQNHEQVVQFCDDVKAGKSGQITIYEILNFAIYGQTYYSEEGSVRRLTVSANFAGGEPSVDEPQTADRFELTPNGHLLIHYPEGTFSESSEGYCVVPHDPKLRELRRKYVDPVGYSAGGTLTKSWSVDDLSALNFEFCYETIKSHEAGTYFCDIYPPLDDSNSTEREVPADEADALLISYFPVTAEKLHTLPTYDADRKLYKWMGFCGGGYSPTAEVTACVENPDGSLTLTVGALSLEFGEEYTTVSQLTVLPRADSSFQYRSNVVSGA